MRHRILASFLATLIAGNCIGKDISPPPESRPKLVVLISLDQFRWDYFTRFMPFFGATGFRRFVDEGAVLTNVHYRHAATVTCAGHATLSTGTNADVNGIVSNDWYDMSTHRNEYCVEDKTVKILGGSGDGRSPRMLRAPTVGDLLKAASPASKVFTVSGKDRAAIMLAGHSANGAYWLMDSVMTSSTYYMRRLPAWVDRFNGLKLPQKMHGAIWDRVLSEEAYDTTQGPDMVWNEDDRYGLGKTFPHPITGSSDGLDPSYYAALHSSPFEDEIVLQFVEDLIGQERLGDDDITDFLGIGFSTVDHIGHAYGPDSHEIMDNVVRTDSVLTKLFEFLDQQVGMQNVLVILSADHGVQRLPELVADPEHGVQAGRVSTTTMIEDVSAVLDSAYGKADPSAGWVESLIYPNVYLRREPLRKHGVTVEEAADLIARELPKLPRYDAAFAASGADVKGTPEQYSIYPGRSGDVLIRLAKNFINTSSEFGTSHGTPWEADTHVPMLWLGVEIKKGAYTQPHNVVDLAPTLATILGLTVPREMEGQVLHQIIAEPLR